MTFFIFILFFHFLQGTDKRELLTEFLKEILLGENSIKFQRLHSEYQEQLQGLSEESL